MSTIKVDTITNGTADVNFPYDVKVGAGGFVQREYYSQATKPTPLTNGAGWYDTGKSLNKVYLGGDWYIVNAS